MVALATMLGGCASTRGGVVSEVEPTTPQSHAPSGPVVVANDEGDSLTVAQCLRRHGSATGPRDQDAVPVADACRQSRGDALVCHPSNWIPADAAGCIGGQGHAVREVSLRFEPAFDSVVWLVRADGDEPGSERLALVRAVDGLPMGNRDGQPPALSKAPDMGPGPGEPVAAVGADQRSGR